MRGPKREYGTPRLVEYGSIGAHTFTNPGGHVKNCTVRCNVDSFGESAGRPDWAHGHPAS